MCLCLLVSARCLAQRQPDIAGDWQGHFTNQQKPPFTAWLKIEKSGRNKWKAIFYKVDGEPHTDEEIFEIDSEGITLNGSKLKFSVDSLPLAYSGDVSADGSTIDGVATVESTTYPLRFIRTFAPRAVTVRELKAVVEQLRGVSDAEAARQLYQLELSERLSDETLSRYEAQIQGREAKTALRALADASAFLDLPQDEILARPQPDAAEQSRMIAQMVQYISDTIHRLPNFLATRTTTAFQRNLWSDPLRNASSGPPMPLHVAGRFKYVVRYQSGEERTVNRNQSATIGLTTSGEFGPVLGTAMLDAAQGNLAWSHWEQGPSGPEAVYRYAIDAKRSHYVVEGQRTAYAGEIAINPDTGEVHRLILRATADLMSSLSIADIMVEYGPVDLGGKTYICPVRGVALSQGFQMLWLNDITFDDYHLFRSTSRILPGFEDEH